LSGAATPPDAASFDQRLAAALRGWGPAGIAAFLVVGAGAVLAPPIAAALGLVWLWLSRTSLRELGMARPKSWTVTIAGGLLLGILLKFAMKAGVLPLLGADPVNQAYHYLAHNTPAALEFAAYALYGAGFAEEFFFRGYLFERLGKLFGPSRLSLVTIVIVTTGLFGLAHFAQGPFGVVNALFIGLAFAVIYAAARNLWFVMAAHASFDLTALAMIYYDVEYEVAHAIFN
jgi:membrane protease YdiL (CAAX protease family)